MSTITTCPVCQADSKKNDYSAKEMYYGLREQFQYEECPDCNALYMPKLPDNMSTFYADDYHCHSAKQQKASFKALLSQQRDKATLTKRGALGKVVGLLKASPTIYKTLSKLNLTVDSKILDVGCGGGDLLRELKYIGFKNLNGIDPYLPEALATDAPGFSLKKLTLEKIDGKYDAIMLNHSLEHMLEHREILHHIRRLLQPEGYACIRMPLTNSVAWQNYRTDWFQLDAPRHVILHSEKSFVDLATSCGFCVKEIAYDATIVQFSRSEIYKKNISSKEFWDKYNGDITHLFDSDTIENWKRKTEDLNRRNLGDQAAFFLAVDA